MRHLVVGGRLILTVTRLILSIVLQVRLFGLGENVYIRIERGA
jgi:hypothetical protein